MKSPYGVACIFGLDSWWFSYTEIQVECWVFNRHRSCFWLRRLNKWAEWWLLPNVFLTWIYRTKIVKNLKSDDRLKTTKAKIRTTLLMYIIHMVLQRSPHFNSRCTHLHIWRKISGKNQYQHTHHTYLPTLEEHALKSRSSIHYSGT